MTHCKDFEVAGEVTKIDEELGLVFGWAVVCLEKGQRYFDLQGDHITERAMLKASTEFMADLRVAKEMHVGGMRGEVVHSMPLTKEVAEAFGIESDRTGLMIAMRPDAEMMAKFKSGELKGFSIGGRRGPDDEEVS